MTHYVVVLDWAANDAEGVEIIAVKHTPEEAKQIFDEQLVNEMKLAKENGWHIEVNSNQCFEAYEEGWYATAHSALYVEEVTE